MGDKGSTRWRGVPVKALVERRPRLDAYHLLRRGLLEPGRAGVLEDTGLNSFCGRNGRLFLWKKGLIQDVTLTTVSRLVGKTSPLFLCACGRKVQHLYQSRGDWECRTCANLNYACQQMRPLQRSERRLRALFYRLWPAWFPHYTPFEPFEPLDLKPPRMWRKTYRRLKNQYILEFLKLFTVN